MQPYKRPVWQPTGPGPIPPEQAQSEKSQGVSGDRVTRFVRQQTKENNPLVGLRSKTSLYLWDQSLPKK